jgi:TRAP-type C4-dicarboxylate transport system substrate-binding protein
MIQHHPIRIFSFTLGVFLLFSQLLFAAESSVTIKLATLVPEGSSWMKTFKTLNSEVMKKTESRVQFRIYPGGVLGDERDMLRKMKIGQIHGAVLTTGSLSSLFKEVDVLQVPFLFQKYEEVDVILKKMDAFFRKGFEESGYIFLSWSEGGFINLMSTVPIASVADMKKAKVWIWEESPMAKAIFDEAGVKAIPLSVPDVLVGLQTGLVDVVYIPPTAAISLQWFTKIKYFTDVPLSYLTGGAVVKKEIFKGLSPSDQNVVMETFQRQFEELKGVTRNENQEAIKVMTKQGVKVIVPSKDQLDEFKRLSAKAMGKITGQTFSKKVLEEVTSSLEQYRKGGN